MAMARYKPFMRETTATNPCVFPISYSLGWIPRVRIFR